jgi:hypothetical protein
MWRLQPRVESASYGGRMARPTAQTGLKEAEQLPELARRYVSRALPPGASTPRTVRVRQVGEMWKKPGARAMRFEASEDFAVERVAFTWRARFPIVGPLALTVTDGLADGVGRLRVSLLGLPLQTQRGPETNLGEAMRYLAELPWAPQAVLANRELEWRSVDERTLEVSCAVASATATVRWTFDAEGDPVRVTGMRPMPVGKAFALTRWGGDFAEHTAFAGTRVPARGEAWWELATGRFVYWRGRVTALETI